MSLKSAEEIVSNKYALGGSTNSGLSWHQDHKRHNKSESYEIPMSKRKFADGGGVDEVKINNNKYDVAILFDTTYDKYKIENEKIIDLLNQYSVVINKKYDVLYIKLNFSKNYKQLLKELSKIENNYQSVIDVVVFTEKYNGGRSIQEKDYFAEGGGIQIGGIYKVDGKDYLFDSPKQNANGQYTSWMAYEVVYDMKEGEKHINYERTKKAMRLKSFPNNVKRENVSSDYFASGGMVGSEIEFNKYGESRTGTIFEDYGDDTYGVQSGTSKVLVEKDDITRTLEPQMKRKFGFFEDGGGVEDFYGNDNSLYLSSLSKEEISIILENIANHYGVSQNEIYAEVTDFESKALYEYVTDDSLRMKIYREMNLRFSKQ
jgi:hypothetical protein